jgi:hypothetical protein
VNGAAKKIQAVQIAEVVQIEKRKQQQQYEFALILTPRCKREHNF